MAKKDDSPKNTENIKQEYIYKNNLRLIFLRCVYKDI